jgi:hypothetical protein
MSRYLAIWEPNLSRWPTDPKEAHKFDPYYTIDLHEVLSVDELPKP